LYDASMPEEDWGAQLAQGFEILLRAPLSTFDTDATYAFHHCDEVVSDEFFDEGLDLELLTSGAIVGAPFDGVPVLAETVEHEALSWKDWRVTSAGRCSSSTPTSRSWASPGPARTSGGSSPRGA
jgi:hypothetical protein